MVAPFVPFFVYFIFGHLFLPVLGIFTSSQEMNSLNGKHLRVLTMEVLHFIIYFYAEHDIMNVIFQIQNQFPTIVMTKRNATGHIIEIDGVQMHLITTLSSMLNFRYTVEIYVEIVYRIIEFAQDKKTCGVNLLNVLLFQLFLSARRCANFWGFSECTRSDILSY